MRRIQWLIFYGFMGFFVWHMFSWFVWSYWVPPPILDWKISNEIITSPSHTQVILKKVSNWEIEGRVIFRQRIVDPVLPTIGKFPESFISPIDVFIARDKWVNPKEFEAINAHHEFRTAWFESKLSGFKPGYVAHQHTIPANYRVFQELLDIKKGDMVKFKGSLVDISVIDPDQVRKYVSSDSLYDTDRNSSRAGSGACEILFVESVEKF